MKSLLMLLIVPLMIYAEVLPQDFSSTQVDGRLNKMNGDTAEYVMHKLFKKNGWSQIHGEVGSNGIDGLYVKYDKNGNVRQVMVAESKYGNANLGTNKYGTPEKNVKQMSQKALGYQVENLMKDNEKKLQEAIASNDKAKIKEYRLLQKQYSQIGKHIEKGNYKARLFHLKMEGNTLSFNVKKILPNGETSILKQSLFGRENYKFNGLKIDFDNPKTKFEKSLVKYYNHGRYKALQKNFGFSSLEAKALISKKGKLLQGDIEKAISIRKYIFNSVQREYRSTLRQFRGSYKDLYKLKQKIHIKWKKKWFKLLRKSIK